MASAPSVAAPPSTVFPRSHVGFDSITSQIEKKLLKRGFQFNVMCVGQLPTILDSTCHKQGTMS
jgi:septin 3/9/12